MTSSFGAKSLNRLPDDRIVEIVQPGDRIVIMGARDDTLSQFAKDVLERLP